MASILGMLAGLGTFVFLGPSSRPELPNWMSQIDIDDVTTAAIVMAALSAAAILLGGYLGGRIGDAHNRKVDAALIDDTVHPPAYLAGR